MGKGFNQLEVTKDGKVVVGVNADGLPAWTGNVPAPFMSDEERQKRHAAALEDAALRGFIVTSQRLVRNLAFDKRGEKTTLKIHARTPKNEAEAKAVAQAAMRILESK